MIGETKAFDDSDTGLSETRPARRHARSAAQVCPGIHRAGGDLRSTGQRCAPWSAPPDHNSR